MQSYIFSITLRNEYVNIICGCVPAITFFCMFACKYICFAFMKSVKAFILVYVLWLLLGVASKIVFLLTYHDLFVDLTFADVLGVVGHGVKLDMAIAGYLTIVPAVVLLCGIWLKGKYMLAGWRTLMALLIFAAIIFYAVNLGLYGYWGFPLDSTPWLYLKTSPTDALASISLMQTLASIAGILALTVLTYCLFEWIVVPKRLFDSRTKTRWGKNAGASILMLLLMALLILPIRGGFGTGTNHTGSVYFSSNMRLNHAAVNPIFSFVESLLHTEDIANQFRFMDDEEATRLFDEMVYTELRKDENPDSLSIRFSTRPNVIIVMLESFSTYIMDVGGHVKGVTPQLDALAKEGLYFDRFYANTVRTDRAMVSILSGLPAQPSMSIMDMPKKSTKLPSIARSLRNNGYTTSFYYGGDTNYSNMQSYIVGTGYENVVSESSFPPRQRTSKWGVHDGIVFERILKDIDEMDKNKPFLITMMTLSSHEPFEVPYESGIGNEALNAFAYTDDELGRFIEKLKEMPLWDNTLVVIVPDHLGAYPDDVDNYQLWRYEIPLIMTGGVAKEHREIHTIGSQIDIAATLLGMLNIDHSDFTYSKDMFDINTPHFAYIAFPDASFGLITEENQVLYDGVPDAIVWDVGEQSGKNINYAKAFVQKLYDDIDGM